MTDAHAPPRRSPAPRRLRKAAAWAGALWSAASALAGACFTPPPPTAATAAPGTPSTGGAETAPAGPIEVRVLRVGYGAAEGAGGAAPGLGRAQARARAANLASMAREGTDLGQLIREYGEGPPSQAQPRQLSRGDPTLPPALVEAAFAMEVGDISPPIEAAGAFWVLERRPDPPVGPTQIRARHILIGHTETARPLPGVTRDRASARALAEEVAAQARRAGADWDALAAKYTDEPGGKATGGDLGAFGRGAMVPAFERAAFALQVGEVSDVVETQFGFHVIQRTQ